MKTDDAAADFITDVRPYRGVDGRHARPFSSYSFCLSLQSSSGGVLDVFYPPWKMKVATNERLFRITAQLWRAAYCHSGESMEDLSASVRGAGEEATPAAEGGDDEAFRWHPHGAFDCDRGYMYIDRIGYRIPTKIAEEIGKNDPTASNPLSNKKRGKRRSRPIQRSLTPHLDCCPETHHRGAKAKWRPIQCFVSLTDASEPNAGGFEALPGFHREFRAWAENGRRTTTTAAAIEGGGEGDDRPPPSPTPLVRPPCVGEYTHLRPKEDASLFRRVRHIPAPAGSAVFWDERIPHGNSYRNDSDVPRAVVYCSFLPYVEANRRFVLGQLEDWRAKRPPRAGDRWIDLTKNGDGGDGGEEKKAGERKEGERGAGDGDSLIDVDGAAFDVLPPSPPSVDGDDDDDNECGLSELGKKLIGLSEW